MRGDTRDTDASSRCARVTNAPKRARPTRQAEPMAKPLPMAAVVLPAASSASVTSRTFSGRLESMPSAARATPYMSPR